MRKPTTPRHSSFRYSQTRQFWGHSVNFVAKEEEDSQASGRQGDEYADEDAEASVDEYLQHLGYELHPSGHLMADLLSDDDEESSN